MFVQNSIRHNLSLHSRFMRIQNEGTGKSSWWVINPDAKPGKAPRRRAGSMETKNSVSKRGRLTKLKKRVEAMKADMENGENPLTNVDYLDALAYDNFRTRADSNASSCGRLSPIQAGVETDLHDNQVPSMSPIPWDGETDTPSGLYQGGEPFSDLVESLVVGMKLSAQDSMDLSSSLNSDPYLSSSISQDYSNSPQPVQGLTDGLGESGQFSSLPAPPPYPEGSVSSPSTSQLTPMTTIEETAFSNGTYAGLCQGLKTGLSQSPDMHSESVSGIEHVNGTTQLSVNTQPQLLASPNVSQQNSPNSQAFSPCLSPQVRQANSQQDVRPQLSQHLRALLGSRSPVQRSSPSLQAQPRAAPQQSSTSILRKALIGQGYNQTTTSQFFSPTVTSTTTPNNINSNLLSTLSTLSQQQQLQQQQLSLSSTTSTTSGNNFQGELGSRVVNNAFTCANNQINSNNNIPLDIDADSLISMECDNIDVDQVIKQELSLEGTLDFNFDNFQLPASTLS